MERDLYFEPPYPIPVYAQAARAGYIVEFGPELDSAAQNRVKTAADGA